MASQYGNCSKCSSPLHPVWFSEEEMKAEYGMMRKTGRKRRAVDFLECTGCGKKECVDDSFDGGWYHG